MFCGGLVVQLLEPWVGDMHGALGTVHSRAERVIGDLVSSHLVLLIATVAVWVDAGHIVPVQDLEEGLT